MITSFDQFKEIWFVDFEFGGGDGGRQKPICMVAQELRSGREIRVWQDELFSLSKPPYRIDKDACFIGYYVPAELKCHLVLNWPLPVNVVDFYSEFRCQTNGRKVFAGNSLLGALEYFGLNSMSVADKKQMRNLALRGSPWTKRERRELLDYCAEDTKALARLFPKLTANMDVRDALLRGAYMRALSVIEDTGVPIDSELLGYLRIAWDDIQDRLIEKVDTWGIYEGSRFRRINFEKWLIESGIPWPRLDTGSLDLKDETFRQMAKIYPSVQPLHELRATLGKMRLNKLAVGEDGRNRTLLSGFAAKTSRNLPSSNKYVFGPARWIRGLIKPPPGYGLAYIDWSQQELGIAAVLSDDSAMLAAYESGDFYLQFGKQAGAIPPYGTKETHASERELFKQCSLGVNYGMGAQSLALRIDKPEIEARQLLALHRNAYPRFWQWSNNVQDYGYLHRKLWTVFRWYLHVEGHANPRSLRNFPVQANGAEMLRLACIEAVRQGVKVCGPIHDALLVEASLDKLDEVVAKTRAAMAKASRVILNGFELRTDVEKVRYPHRYMDVGGKVMWNIVMECLAEVAEAGIEIESA